MSVIRVDPTGEFSKRRFRSAEDILRKEMKFVQSESRSRSQKLLLAPNSQIGLELLHLFVLDILGRDTPAAKIFMTKSSTE